MYVCTIYKMSGSSLSVYNCKLLLKRTQIVVH